MLSSIIYPTNVLHLSLWYVAMSPGTPGYLQVNTWLNPTCIVIIYKYYILSSYPYVLCTNYLYKIVYYCYCINTIHIIC